MNENETKAALEALPPGVHAAVLEYRARSTIAGQSFVDHCLACTEGDVERAKRTAVIRERDTGAKAIAFTGLMIAIEAWK